MATLHPARAYTIAQELPMTPDPAMAVFEIVIHTSLLTLGTRTVAQTDFLGGGRLRLGASSAAKALSGPGSLPRTPPPPGSRARAKCPRRHCESRARLRRESEPTGSA